MQISDEIKAKLDIVEIIREYVPSLKAVGVNFSALSPFKREKTPSFIVSPDKQIWHCFSTGKGGDVITFVMEMEGVSFVEALRILAPRAGVVLKRENPEMTSKRNRILDILEASVSFYHKTLLESPLAENARQYLKKRGLKDETIMDWKIGFSLDSWDDLQLFLKKRGATDPEIFAAGLSAKKEGRNSFYNRFRGRIMFPINSINGEAVAFTARVSPEKEATEMMGKYVNSPQTALYDKSRTVFGLDKAKMAIKNEGFAIVVEGQMDCISCHQAGFKNVVASSGTAFTAEQLKLIKRYSNNIYFSFDMDEAGQLAADRGIKEALAEEMNIKVIVIPSGKDPDELIRNNLEEWKRAIIEARSVKDYYFGKIFSIFKTKEDGGRKLAIDYIFNIIICLPNSIARNDWIKELAEKFGINETDLREDLKRFQEKKNKSSNYQENKILARVEEAERKPKEELLSESLLALILKFPIYFEYVLDRLPIDCFFGRNSQLLYRTLTFYYNDIVKNSADRRLSELFNYSELKGFLENRKDNPEESALPNFLDKLVILGDRDFFSLDADKSKNEVIKMVRSLKSFYGATRCKEIEKEIAREEKAGNQKEATALFEELKNLKEEFSETPEEIENN